MKDFTLDDDFLSDFEDDIELAAEFVDAVSEWIESDEESKLFFTVSLDCVFFARFRLELYFYCRRRY